MAIHGGPTGFTGFEIVKMKNQDTFIRRQGELAVPGAESVTEIKPSYIHSPNYNYTPEMISTWEPYMGLDPVSDDGFVMNQEMLTAKRIESEKQLSAATSTKTSKIWRPSLFSNPMQDLDYMLVEGILKATFVGPLMNSLTRFIIGTGFRPELELINPDEDDDVKNAEIIRDHQDIIRALRAIDMHVDRQPGFNDISFIEKMAMLVDATNSFNRAALVFHHEGKPFKYNDVEYPEVPNGIKYAHPRSLGIIDIEPDTHRLQAVQWEEAYEMVDIKDMIYLWNPLISAKYSNAMHYGGSMVMPMMDAARVIRAIVGTDFPAMARSTWAGMPVIVVKPHGQSKEQKLVEYQGLVSKFVRGGAQFPARGSG